MPYWVLGQRFNIHLFHFIFGCEFNGMQNLCNLYNEQFLLVFVFVSPSLLPKIIRIDEIAFEEDSDQIPQLHV